jgi:hypothetical protein
VRRASTKVLLGIEGRVSFGGGGAGRVVVEKTNLASFLFLRPTI